MFWYQTITSLRVEQSLSPELCFSVQGIRWPSSDCKLVVSWTYYFLSFVSVLDGRLCYPRTQAVVLVMLVHKGQHGLRNVTQTNVIVQFDSYDVDEHELLCKRKTDSGCAM